MTALLESETESTMANEPVVYWGPAEIGALFGVPGDTVVKWRRRYHPNRTAAEIAKAPTFPQPDIILGTIRPIFGWHPDREPEFREWRASLPGQGAGGGRKPREIKDVGEPGMSPAEQARETVLRTLRAGSGQPD